MGFFSSTNGSVQYRRSGETVLIEPYGPDCLRVRATVNGSFNDATSVLLPPLESNAQITADDNVATITSGRLRATIDAAGRICFGTTDGRTLLEEVAFARGCAHLPASRQYDNGHGNLHRIAVRFAAREGERFYGMGQRTHGRLDQKGCVLELAHRNTQATIPFLLSSEGYGLIWNVPSYGRAELAANHTCWIAEAARQVDYVVVAGEGPREILSKYTDITGRSPMIPQWATGFWQCKLRYRTQDELMGIARKYKKLGLPLSVIVIDFFHWTAMGEWQFDPKCWPDPDAMVRELSDMGVKLMVSVWPAVGPWAKTFPHMVDSGMLLKTNSGTAGLIPIGDNGHPEIGEVAFYDSTNPAARDFVWDRIREGYLKHDIDAFWLDACEPEMIPFQPQNVRCHMGPATEVGNLYPFYHQKMVYEGLQRANRGDVLTLCRSAWLGSQRYGAALWSGDIHSTWANLKMSVPAGLNAMMSGLAWWTTDIGGFCSSNANDPAFHELLVRWFEYGVFCPLFRLHGARDPFTPDPNACIGVGAPNEIWSYGPQVYQKIAPLLMLRERLRPYIREQMQLTHEAGVPIMRPMFFEFDGDDRCARIEDQFMFGPGILVAPVTQSGAEARSVYLPAGSTWTHAWTGQSFAGGQTVSVPAPLGQGPVFLRDGKVSAKLFADLECPPLAANDA